MSTDLKPPGKAMYVAPRPDWDWLRGEQRKLYTRREQVDHVFRKIWGLIIDLHNLRMADPTGELRPAGLSLRFIMESRVHNERCMPGSEGGARRPAGESR